MEAMTPEQIAKAMQKAMPPGSEGTTQEEIASLMGWSRAKTMRTVSRLIEAGAMRCVGRIRKMRVDGIVGHKPAYVLTNPPKKKQKDR